jgi:hypothetical protein
MEIISLDHKNSVSYQEVVDEFIKNKSWRDLVEKDHNPIEDVTNEAAAKGDTLVAGKPIKIEMNDFLTLMLCVAVAAFCRLQQMNVQNNSVTPLRTNDEEWFQNLGPILQTYCTPHPGRVYDPTPLTFICSSDSQGEGRKARNGVEWMKAFKAETMEIVFSAIIGTTTGRMAGFYRWSKYKRLIMEEHEKTPRESKVIFFPRPSETAEFLEFLLKATKNEKMGRFISGQFRCSIPPCFQTTTGYGRFLKEVSLQLEDFYEKLMTELEKNECTKEKLVEIMKEFIEEKCNGGVKKDLSFLASQIIYNIDESIDLIPKKDWEEVKMGYGSEQAITWLLGKFEKGQMMEVLKEIKKEVLDLSDEKLYCLGLKRVKYKKRSYVVWAVNLRVFGLQDCEHFLCKLWIVMVKVAGGRPSKNPKLHYPHLHPVKVDKEDVPGLFGKWVLDIAVKATTTFEKKQFKIPDLMGKW